VFDANKIFFVLRPSNCDRLLKIGDMKMAALDWMVVLFFLVGLLVMGFFLAKRAGKSSEEFILAGRKLPWWLAGTSIIAAALNASTMLQDSRKIREDGIGGMWFTWRWIFSTAISTIWFDRLWRRARFTTQMEFYQARYSGYGAVFARIYDSIIYGIVVAIAWASIGVIGMKKILPILFDFPQVLNFAGISIPTNVLMVIVLIGVAAIYSIASGVYGVVWTDLVEFLVALGSSYILVFLVYKEVGGNVGLQKNS